MKLYQKMITYGALIAGLVGLTGCEVDSDKTHSKEIEITHHNDYFATVPTNLKSRITISSGDFDGDGDLDFIVGITRWSRDGELRIFINDGKGNFTLKKPTTPAEKQD
jgi:hypothetical protein